MSWSGERRLNCRIAQSPAGVLTPVRYKPLPPSPLFPVTTVRYIPIPPFRLSLPIVSGPSISYSSTTMPGLVADATRIWELNLYWPLHAQCGVWDPKGKGVDVWECIRPRESSPPHSPLAHIKPLPRVVFQTTPLRVHRYAPALHFLRVIIFTCLLFQPPNNLYWRYVARR